jgi:heme-degrading monooxygenase HmoA
MSRMIVNQKVEDFNKWKSAFDSVEPVRRKYGSTGASVFRGLSDPNSVVIITDWGNADQAHKYSQSPELKEAMKRGGVNGDSKFYFVE